MHNDAYGPKLSDKTISLYLFHLQHFRLSLLEVFHFDLVFLLPLIPPFHLLYTRNQSENSRMISCLISSSLITEDLYSAPSKHKYTSPFWTLKEKLVSRLQ